MPRHPAHLVRVFTEAEALWESMFDAMHPVSEVVWSPPTDLFLTERRVVIIVELPGVRPDQISISVAPNVLRLQGYRPAPAEFRAGTNFYELEIPYGWFERRLNFPCPVDTSSLRVRFRQGLLVLEFARQRAPARRAADEE